MVVNTYRAVGTAFQETSKTQKGTDSSNLAVIMEIEVQVMELKVEIRPGIKLPLIR